jgi:hypothetical protein
MGGSVPRQPVKLRPQIVNCYLYSHHVTAHARRGGWTACRAGYLLVRLDLQIERLGVRAAGMQSLIAEGRATQRNLKGMQINSMDTGRAATWSWPPPIPPPPLPFCVAPITLPPTMAYAPCSVPRPQMEMGEREILLLMLF